MLPSLSGVLKRGRKTFLHTPLTPIPEEYSAIDLNSECQKAGRSNVFHYTLSDKKYIDKGWTVLPTHKMMKKEKIYLPISRRITNDFISTNNETGNIQPLKYKDGLLLAEVDQRKISKIFYKDGKVAIDVNSFEIKGHSFQRYVVRNDESDSILAIFDTLGRGAVSDQLGNIRLKYNQLEGMLLDDSVGTPRTWKWHKDGDEPEYENVMFDTFIQPPDEDISQIILNKICNKTELQVSGKIEKKSLKVSEKKSLQSIRLRITPEVQILKHFPAKNKVKTHNYVVPNESTKQCKENDARTERSSDITIFKNIKVFCVQQIKPMTVKLNDFLSLKITTRKNMYITFLHDCWNMKIYLGIELTNECIDSFLMEAEFAWTDYDVALLRINTFLQNKAKKQKKCFKPKKIKQNQ